MTCTVREATYVTLENLSKPLKTSVDKLAGTILDQAVPKLLERAGNDLDLHRMIEEALG